MIEKGFTIPVLDKGYVRLIDWSGSDQRIVEAARISYNSPSKGEEQDKKLLQYLWKHKHTSPFEQCAITFNIRLPLFVQGQLVRHRTQKLNQMSLRYTEAIDDFYIPQEWRTQDVKNKQGGLSDIISDNINMALSEELEEYCEASFKYYNHLLKDGVCREMARMVLPQNLYTEVYTQFDLSNLLHFFTLRRDEHSQWEIREYANAMYDIFKELFPWTHEAFEKYKWKLVEN